MPFIRPVHHQKKNGGGKCRDGTSAAGTIAWYIDIKVVPGARREQISGLLGTRLKVRVSAPPEDGKANKAVCRLIAGALGIKASCVTIASGASSAEKTLHIEGVGESVIRDRLGDSRKE